MCLHSLIQLKAIESKKVRLADSQMALFGRVTVALALVRSGRQAAQLGALSRGRESWSSPTGGPQVSCPHTDSIVGAHKALKWWRVW